MSQVRHQRCFNHGFREAVARCPSCSHYFCRECITEHDERMICARCLEKQLAQPTRSRVPTMWLLNFGQLVFGFLIAWVAFYFVGQVLLETPSQLHEGTLWQEDWLWLD